ncbi:hypothetical protein [Nannocystis pusilla]|uniref:hypothetical protein n=1 Tax=Nannocystis pusilla TaxID=889268 RepID=UPI003B77EB17
MTYVHTYPEAIETYPRVWWSNRWYYNINGNFVYYSPYYNNWVYYWGPPSPLVYAWNYYYPWVPYSYGWGFYGNGWYWGGPGYWGYHAWGMPPSYYYNYYPQDPGSVRHTTPSQGGPTGSTRHTMNASQGGPTGTPGNQGFGDKLGRPNGNNGGLGPSSRPNDLAAAPQGGGLGASGPRGLTAAPEGGRGGLGPGGQAGVRRTSRLRARVRPIRLRGRVRGPPAARARSRARAPATRTCRCRAVRDRAARRAAAVAVTWPGGR